MFLTLNFQSASVPISWGEKKMKGKEWCPCMIQVPSVTSVIYRVAITEVGLEMLLEAAGVLH